MTSSRGLSHLAASLACLFLFTGCGGGEPREGGPGSPAQPTRTWQLKGTVSEGGSNKRLSAMRVEVVDGPNAGKYTSTDSNGNYQFAALTESGFSVRASGAGHDPVTQGVTLTSDQTIDFSLPMGAPVLTLSFDPTTITVSASGDSDYPNELDFTLSVQESNYVDVWVEAIYFVLVTPAGEPLYWECDNEWLRQYYLPLRIGGGNTKPFRMALIYDGPIAAGTLTAGVEVKDSAGNVFTVLGDASVQPGAPGRVTGFAGEPGGHAPRLAPTRR